MTTTLDQDLAVSGVRVPNTFLVAAVEFTRGSLLAVEGLDDLVRLTVP
jgi:hypothetical protein